jgi:hypothetical protein
MHNSKKIEKYLLLSLLLFILTACQQKTVNRYYDTGELWYEKHYLYKDTNTILVKEYYKNGVLKEEGNIKRGRFPDGHWKEYYSDGVLKYEGDYSNGRILLANYSIDGTWPNLEYIAKNMKCEVLENTGTLKVGQQLKLRFLMRSVHPIKYIVLDKNLEVLKPNPEDPDRYPFVYTPTETNEVYFWMIFINKNGSFTLRNPSLVINMGKIGSVPSLKISVIYPSKKKSKESRIMRHVWRYKK